MSTYPENPQDVPEPEIPITCPYCDLDAYEDCECDEGCIYPDPDLDPNREDPTHGK